MRKIFDFLVFFAALSVVLVTLPILWIYEIIHNRKQK